MIFSSVPFLFLFLPAVLTGFYLLRRFWRPGVKPFLVLASLTFYGIGQPDYLLIFTLSMVLNYALVVLLDKLEGKAARGLLLTAAVLWNVGLLVYFKYTNFLLDTVNRLLGTHLGALSVILPIGISFYTFQILSYTIAVFRREAALAQPLDYALFITFFPQLIVGPVVRHDEILDQLSDTGLYRFDWDNLCRGALLFSVGCAKKILLANPMIDYATAFYGGSVAGATTAQAWMGVLAFTFAYYFDFSGYIDMARGLGYLFGIRLPVNFDSPYRAADFADFWRRWNMTISRFFNEAIFNNLFHFGDRVPKLILATLATFLVSGLWHGPAWHFVVWGLVNGVLVCVSNLCALRRIRLPKIPAIAVTFLVSALARVLFDANGLAQAVQVYRRLFSPAGWSTFLSDGAALISAQGTVALLVLVSAVICFACPNSNRIDEKKTFTGRDALAAGVLLMTSVFRMSEVSTFLYFNF